MDERVTLARLAAERGDDLAALSRLIGRNAAYVQQYIRRGTPRRLAEDDRRTLARYFGVPEEMLGGRAPEPANGHVAVARLDVGASAGAGRSVESEQMVSQLAFDAAWLRRIGAGNSSMLSVIRVEGDSMSPTLANGDEILVDRADAADRLREGIYVLRRDNALMVKRLSPSPAGGTVSITSDNKDYPSWPDCPLTSIDLVGRVIWCGRRLG